MFNEILYLYVNISYISLHTKSVIMIILVEIICYANFLNFNFSAPTTIGFT